MKKAILLSTCATFILSGCLWEEKVPEPTSTPRSDLVTQVSVDEEGIEKPVLINNTNKVQNKTANIRTNQLFEKIESSHLVIEENTTTIQEYIKDSTIVIEDSAVLLAPYIKNSTIVVEEGGDLQVTERLKETKITLKGGDFSVQPAEVDDKSEIIKDNGK